MEQEEGPSEQPILKVKQLPFEMNKERLGQLPTLQTPGSCGYDLYAGRDTIVPAKYWATIPTKICIEMPPNTVGQIWSKSGLSFRRGIGVLTGIIDNDYRGEIHVTLFNHSNLDYKVLRRDPIAQMVIVPYIQAKILPVETLSETQRGDRGISTIGNEYYRHGGGLLSQRFNEMTFGIHYER